MTRYWLDASVFIEAHNRSYPIGIVDSDWKWIAGKVGEGTIVCPKLVYQEIVNGYDRDDALGKWFQTRKSNGLCIPPDQAVQKQVGIITNYVFTKYKSHQAMAFSKGADVWIIAHALVDQGIVVTQESSLHPNAQKARIPDVCKQFNLPCIDGLQMLKKLKARI
jgi:Domain of unknown function (DUF4411)